MLIANRYIVVLGALACALGLSLGCSETEEGISPCGKQGCAESCRDLPRGNCDIRKDRCQETIFKAVKCVRGTSGEVPQIEVITEDEYRERLESAFDEPDAAVMDAAVMDAAVMDADMPERHSPEADAPDPTEDDAGEDDASEHDASEHDEDEADHWSTALSLLGLLSPETDLAEAHVDTAVDHVIGFYDPSDKAVFLIDRDKPVDDDYAQIVLAHEFVHALQDQELGSYDFAERTARWTDTRISRDCLVEGDAELYEELAWALLNGLSVRELYWQESLERQLKYERRRVLMSDAPYSAMYVSLKYALGARYLTEVWLNEGNWGVQSLYDAPPISSIYWMMGYEASEKREEHWQLPLACREAAAPEGFEYFSRDTFGPLVLFAFLGIVTEDDGVFASEAVWVDAQQWRGDRIYVFRNDDTNATAVSWRIRFADDDLSKSYASRIEENRKELILKTSRKGKELEILASTDEDSLDKWEGTDPKSCPDDDE